MYKSYDYLELNTLQEIETNYENKFHGRSLILRTNFKPLKELKISFDVLDLPHLLGFQYLSGARLSASEYIQLIKNCDLTIKLLKKDQSFNDKIKDRLKYYNFINSVFYSQTNKIMVVTKDIRPKRLGNVEFLIYDYIDQKKKRMVLIGFSPTSKGYYVPATLHVRTTPNIFTQRRVTEIKEMNWL
ncbi:PBECR4 domain-containing protein [Leuconostoc falkenbergense]